MSWPGATVQSIADHGAGSAECADMVTQLSEYLDGAVTGRTMLRIERHLQQCSSCAAEFRLAEQVQQTIAVLGPVRPPVDLGLRLRLAISHENSRGWRKSLEALHLSWDNAIRPLVLQASAGLVGTVLLVGSIVSLLGAVGATRPVMANDEPLGAITAPHFLYSIDGVHPILTDGEESTVVVEAAVNARGEVYDYRIVAGAPDDAVRGQIRGRLAASVFRPASVFGVPVRGHVVLTYSGISVHG